jgi:hypothetical protein
MKLNILLFHGRLELVLMDRNIYTLDDNFCFLIFDSNKILMDIPLTLVDKF